MKKLLLALALVLVPTLAAAQCTGVFPANTLCGNLTGSPAPPSAFSASGTIVGPGSSTLNGLPKWGNTGGTSLVDAAGTTVAGDYTWSGTTTFNSTNTFQTGITNFAGNVKYTLASPQIYVATTGNDSNSCLTVGAPCLTITHAVDVANQYDAGNNNIIINIGAGTFTESVIISGTPRGSAHTGLPATSLRFIGAGSGSTIVNDTSANCGTFILANSGTNVIFQSMTIEKTAGCGTGGAAIFAQGGSYAAISLDVAFGTSAGQQIHIEDNSTVEVTQDYSITGNAINHIAVASHGVYEDDGHTITCGGSVTAFQDFLLVQSSGVASFLPGTSFSGCGAVTGIQYVGQHNSVIDSGGVALTFPGDVKGQLTDGAVRTPADNAATQTPFFQFGSTVNFNVGTTDTTYTVPIPVGFTRYRIVAMQISNASHSLSTATIGLFTTIGGVGTIIADSAITVTATAESTNNNMQIFTPSTSSTQSFNNANLFVRIGTPEGAAATGTVTLIIQPVS